VKITKVEAIELRLPESEISETIDMWIQDALIVKIHTDEGIIGIGDADSCPRIVKAVIEAPFSHGAVSGLGRLLIGMNPLDIGVINEKLYQSTFYYGRGGHGPLIHAIAAIDVALWDIAGKYYNQPIYQLLGGAFNKKIRAYASVDFGKSGNETCEIGKKWISKGFTAVKFGWMPKGLSEKMELDLVEGARNGIGKENDLLIDGGCCWDTMTAIRRVKQFEPYNLLFLEEPLEGHNMEGYRRLSNVSKIPLAAGEGHPGRFECKDLIEQSGISVVQVDIARSGFTEAVKIADIAEDHGLRVANHFYSTGINLAAGLHWLASRKSAFIFEYCLMDTPLRFNLTKQVIEPDTNGFLHVPEGPGLGVDLNENIMDKYLVKTTAIGE